MSDPAERTSPLRQIVQPFIDLVHAPRALWGVNVGYMLEGMCYFGVLGYLTMFFTKNVGLSDPAAGVNVGVLTWGITFAMFLFGGLADKWGVRLALIISFVLMVVGRYLLAAVPATGVSAFLGHHALTGDLAFGLLDGGLWSPMHFFALAAILFVVLGYGMYQPAAYAAVRLFTTPKTAAMGYAMLYAVMNLGGWFPTFFTPVRKAYGIPGAFWMLTGFTVLSLALTVILLSRRTVKDAIECARPARDGASPTAASPSPAAEKTVEPAPPFSVMRWLRQHPLADPKFAFFIFCLIPVQTLFAHNWLTLPQYVERAYRGTWIGDHFEAAVNFNPILIFVLVPIVAALTQKANVYKMMILGTAVMAAPTFLLALGPNPYLLGAFLVLMTVGEAMWQPRFLQYAAEIAPEGRTGAYMGVAQFPWFLTKLLTSLYSGWFLARYCPDPKDGTPLDTGTMWLVYGCIAGSSTVLLVLAKGWIGKDFKTRHAG